MELFHAGKYSKLLIYVSQALKICSQSRARGRRQFFSLCETDIATQALFGAFIENKFLFVRSLIF